MRIACVDMGVCELPKTKPINLSSLNPNERIIRVHNNQPEWVTRSGSSNCNRSIIMKKVIRSVKEKKSASESKGVLQVRLYHSAIAAKVITKSSISVYRKQPVSGMVTESTECVLTKDAVEFLRASALSLDLKALITVFDHKSEATEKLDDHTDSKHYVAAVKAVLACAAEDLKDKPQLAQDRLIAYTAACRKTVGKFLTECANVINGDAYQREPLTGTVSKSGKPLTQAWVKFGTSSDCLDMLDSTEIKTSVLIGQKSTGCDETTAAEIEVADEPKSKRTRKANKK